MSRARVGAWICVRAGGEGPGESLARPVWGGVRRGSRALKLFQARVWRPGLAADAGLAGRSWGWGWIWIPVQLHTRSHTQASRPKLVFQVLGPSSLLILRLGFWFHGRISFLIRFQRSDHLISITNTHPQACVYVAQPSKKLDITIRIIAPLNIFFCFMYNHARA